MQSEVLCAVQGEYEVQREYLAIGNMGIAELFEKTIHMLVFISENHFGKEKLNGELR